MNALHDLPPYEEAGPLTQVAAHYESERKILWLQMRAAPRPCFNPTLISEISRLGASLKSGNLPVDFWVLGSSMPGFFNTGGDLQLFQEKIRAADRQALTDYADACVVAVHGLMTGFGTSTITISMVEGAALGGGLECALAHQFPLAQSDARMGFPEIAFNLFPGMGAYSTVYRRAGQTLAEELLLTGTMRSGDWYHQNGLVYQVFPPSEGIRAVRTLVDTFIPKLNGVRGTLAARQRVAGISLAELLDVTHAWVERALTLEHKDLAYMARLVNAQSKMSRSTVPA